MGLPSLRGRVKLYRKTMDILKESLESNDHADQAVQEELARSFFSGAKKKKEEPEKVPEKLSPPPKTFKWWWIIAGLMVLVVPFFLILNRHVDIKISVTKKVSDTGTYFIQNGKLNKNIIESFSFLGDAKKLSKIGPESLILINSKGAGWGNFEINFKNPIDFNKYALNYVARGKDGDERLTLVLVDKNNRTYRMRKDFYLKLTENWQNYSVNLRPIKKYIDISNISKIKFEFGGLTTGNASGATILLKDVNIVRM